ncbi:MAG: ferritin family protein, partial [Acidiferrobacterales bacterium]
MDLKGSNTEQNLKDAFAGESQANHRYLYFAAKADVEGYNDVSADEAEVVYWGRCPECLAAA